MGFTPAQIRAMTPWEFAHVRAGWIGANNPDAIDALGAPSDEQIARTIAVMDSMPDTLT